MVVLVALALVCVVVCAGSVHLRKRRAKIEAAALSPKAAGAFTAAQDGEPGRLPAISGDKFAHDVYICFAVDRDADTYRKVRDGLESFGLNVFDPEVLNSPLPIPSANDESDIAGASADDVGPGDVVQTWHEVFISFR